MIAQLQESNLFFNKVQHKYSGRYKSYLIISNLKCFSDTRYNKCKARFNLLLLRPGIKPEHAKVMRMVYEILKEQ